MFNGIVATTDPSTGRPVTPCLVTLRTTRGVFEELDLARVDPMACLAHLNAGVSKKPEELAPVRPVLEFDMVDKRFVEETDVLAELDQRPNLMRAPPTKLEGLIQNLFSKMGLDTKQTRPSRDGGVDCVAYDPRPIFGGKVVIQAKRLPRTPSTCPQCATSSAPCRTKEPRRTSSSPPADTAPPAFSSPPQTP